MPVEALLAELRTSVSGLPDDEARRRLRITGPNLAAPSRPATTARAMASQFFSPISVLLILAAGLSIAVGETVDGSIILGVLLASAALGFWQERRASGAVASLLALIHTTVRVVRGGVERELPIDDIVPGDIVRVAAGSSIPGDGRLIEAKDLFVDQSTLTGESLPADKTVEPSPRSASLADRRGVVYLGTHVVSGTGTIAIARTGSSTEFGAIARRLELRPPETAFERGVRRFGYLLLEIATVLAVCIFAVNVALDRPVLEALLFTLALSVGLTPQLLPAIVSVTLSRGAVLLARSKVIVRRLASIEDLGGMEVLCTDKTGTITEGKAVVQGAEDVFGAASDRVRLLAYLNAAFESGFPNPIDDALRATMPAGAAGFTKADEIPYDFTRKRLSVVVVAPGGSRLLIMKGAVASVLAACTHHETANGTLAPLDGVRQRVEERFESLSLAGYRCLGVAWRDLGADTSITREDERDLAFAGILTVADPIKADTVDAVKQLAALGVQTKIITGDNRMVAGHIAREAGIDASDLLTGAQVHRLGDEALVTASRRASVFAEMEPHQKERVILALRKSGVTVGYLGDGINDAAALHAADVGISVDSATDVTRQAADIVLLDKSLLVLARGVREGRRAFANTLKYVFVTASANFGNMFSMAGASLMMPFLPLLPKQILLTNVLTDLPAMSLATDRTDDELVAGPRRWDVGGIRRFLIVFGLVSSLFDYLTFGVLVVLRASPAAFRTAWFLESVWSELVILLVIRTRRMLFRSRIGGALKWSSIGVAVVTLALPYSPVAPALGLSPIGLGVVGLMVSIVIAYAAVSTATREALLRRTA